MLEAKEIPTATICTNEFARMGQFIAKSLGLSALPLVIINHPLAGISRDAVERKAEAIIEQNIYVLTTLREILEAEFDNKEYPRPTGVCPMTKPGN